MVVYKKPDTCSGIEEQDSIFGTSQYPWVTDWAILCTPQILVDVFGKDPDSSRSRRYKEVVAKPNELREINGQRQRAQDTRNHWVEVQGDIMPWAKN